MHDEIADPGASQDSVTRKIRHANADIDLSWEWSEEDIRDVTLASLRRFEEEESE
ncbi:MAG: hypothetical protein K8T89_21715 [Planctomycetes bacterium]|nr:hypothetical protein [Planctomycetota bacterium]